MGTGPARKMWTRADAQAAMMQASKATLEARKTLFRAASAIRHLGDETGFRSDAEDLCERLGRSALGEPQAGAWIDRSCQECGFAYATRYATTATELACPSCRALRAEALLATIPRSVNGAPEWWEKIQEMSSHIDGCMILPLARDAENHNPRVCISDSPQVHVEPRYLLVDPTVGPGVLEDLRVGPTSLLAGCNGGGAPLSLFNPGFWASSEAMLRVCALQAPERIGPAHRVTLIAQLDRPGPFRAMMWCRAFDHEGRPYN